MIIFLLAFAAHAAPVSIAGAKRVAINRLSAQASHLQAKGHTTVLKGVAGTFTRRDESRDIYHVINLDPEGWVIVSADDVAYPIIAYSHKGHFEEYDRPPALDYWLQCVASDINKAIELNASPLPETQPAWYALDGDPVNLDADVVTGPLLNTIWSQGGKRRFDGAWLPSYDLYCPTEKDSDSHYRVPPVGCVATAMGQIMKYWNWPVSGAGEHSYDPWWPCENQDGIMCKGYAVREVDFSAREYDWKSMPATVEHRSPGTHTHGEQQVQLLLHDIGVAVDMNYHPLNGSGAMLNGWHFPLVCDPNAGGSCDYYVEWNSSAIHALKNFFRYSQSAVYRCKEDFAENWINMLETELDNLRPVLYRGSGSGAHAFVVDGYSRDGSFHVNWGWGGSFDGWYHLDNLTPGSSVFTKEQCGVFGLEPSGPDLTVTRLSIQPDNPDAGQSFQIEISIKNQGLDRTDRVFSVDWYTDADSASGMDQGHAASEVEVSLASGETYEVHLTYPGFSNAGTRNMYVIVDTGNMVMETREDNNILGPVAFEVAVSCELDLTGDGKLDKTDLEVLAAGFGNTGCSDGCVGDIAGDGDVDGMDIADLASGFSQGGCSLE